MAYFIYSDVPGEIGGDGVGIPSSGQGDSSAFVYKVFSSEAVSITMSLRS